MSFRKHKVEVSTSHQKGRSLLAVRDCHKVETASILAIRKPCSISRARLAQSDAHSSSASGATDSWPVGAVLGKLLCLVFCRCGALRAYVGRERGLSRAPGVGAQDVALFGCARVRRTAAAQLFFTAGKRQLWYATLPRFLPLRRSQGPCERVQ